MTKFTTSAHATIGDMRIDMTSGQPVVECLYPTSGWGVMPTIPEYTLTKYIHRILMDNYSYAGRVPGKRVYYYRRDQERG